VEIIEAEMIGDDRKDQDGAGDTEGKSQDIDKSKRFVAGEVAPGDPEIAFDHGT
jgi:hypothetical protein